MPDTNRTESPEERRPNRRRKDPAEHSQPAASREPAQATDALQKDPSPSAMPDDGARFERVRQRAYELYVKRGNSSGDEMEDWLEAERQIDAEPR